VSIDQAAKYEKQAEHCLERSDETADPAEQRLWLAFALEFLRLAAADRDLLR
jgi:hypothetical protein